MIDKILWWSAPKFLIMLLGVGLGYAWCDYHHDLAITEIRIEIQKKELRIERLIVCLGEAMAINPRSVKKIARK